MSNITILTMDFSFQGREDTIHPVVLQDDHHVVLIDCGYVGSLPLLEQELQKNNIELDALTHLVITHHDHDHMGTAAELKEKYPSIQVVASQEETPYISGSEKSLRLIQAEQLQEYLPEEQKEFGEKFSAVVRAVKPVPVDIQVKDGDRFDWCGGCVIVATFGHTLGHISLYVEKEGCLIVGDAATIEKGELVVANPQFTLDPERASHSLNKIKKMNADRKICYHGGEFN